MLSVVITLLLDCAHDQLLDYLNTWFIEFVQCGIQGILASVKSFWKTVLERQTDMYDAGLKIKSMIFLMWVGW